MGDLTVVAIGDSITLGVGDGVDRPSGDVGWAAHAAVALGASRFANLARNGTRARDLAAGQVGAASALDPDVVLMTVGGNDVLRADFSPHEIEDATRTAIEALRRSGALVVIVTLTPIRLFELCPERVEAVMARRIERANAALLAAASCAGALVVDGAAVMALRGPAAWHVDRIHPSPAGHRALAERAVGLLPWPQAREIPAAPRPATASRTVWWLARNGVPWIVKRSRDLIPHVVAVVASEVRAAKAIEARAARALIDERGRIRREGRSTHA